MSDFNTIDVISPDAFEQLFGDNTKTVETKIKEPEKTPAQPFDIPIVNIDDIEKKEETPIVEDEKKEEKVEEEVKVGDDVKVALKNTVNFMIEQGLWEDFEGRDTTEFDNDTYATLALEQNQRQVDRIVNEVLDQTGDYGKAIITHIRQGGNPDEIIDLFKEHKRIEFLGNTDTLEGKSQFVTEYYRKFNNWSEAKAEKYVKGLIESDSLDSEVDEVKDNYKSIQQEEIKELNAQQAAYEAEQQKKREETKANLTRAIDDNPDLLIDEKKALKDSLFRFNQKLENGTVVNKFLYKFTALQNDPKDMLTLYTLL
jgi:desulfoferrodoxin (superoxide reductase-like protein)